uniref:IRG-type G domain-containing protein n=1 Tax=Hucho hucho TaxID=62062 RepID=A0A4W5MBY9_9TELE
GLSKGLGVAGAEESGAGQQSSKIAQTTKKFYFVRSKIDATIDAERKRKKNFNQDERLEKVLSVACCPGLWQSLWGCHRVQFLVELPFYDFPKLGETIDPNMSLKINQRKNEALQANIWRSALVSGWVAAIPISGLSFSVDITILSLQSLAGRTNVPVEELKAVLKSPLNKKISQDTFIKILTKAAGSTLMVAEYFLSTIPVLGSMAAGGMSYGTTYYILKSCLNELTEDAQNVLMKALKVYE